MVLYICKYILRVNSHNWNFIVFIAVVNEIFYVVTYCYNGIMQLLFFSFYIIIDCLLNNFIKNDVWAPFVFCARNPHWVFVVPQTIWHSILRRLCLPSVFAFFLESLISVPCCTMCSRWRNWTVMCRVRQRWINICASFHQLSGETSNYFVKQLNFSQTSC